MATAHLGIVDTVVTKHGVSRSLRQDSEVASDRRSPNTGGPCGISPLPAATTAVEHGDSHEIAARPVSLVVVEHRYAHASQCVHNLGWHSVPESAALDSALDRHRLVPRACGVAHPQRVILVAERVGP